MGPLRPRDEKLLVLLSLLRQLDANWRVRRWICLIIFEEKFQDFGRGKSGIIRPKSID